MYIGGDFNADIQSADATDHKAVGRHTFDKQSEKALEQDMAHNKELLIDLSLVAQVPWLDCEQVLEGLRTVALRGLRDKGHAAIPNVINLKLRTLKRLPAKKILVMGEEKELPACQLKKKVSSHVLKSFAAAATQRRTAESSASGKRAAALED